MRFKGLSEPLVGRVCSAKTLERHVGAGFLGPIRSADPVIELMGVAISDDEEHLMVHVHAATETMTFLGTTEVTVRWYERQFETNTFLRGSPDDSRAVSVIPCQFFESPTDGKRARPTVADLVAEDPYEFSRGLASNWLRGKRPVRRTEQFFITMLGNTDEEVRRLAQSGLVLLAEALSARSISPVLKRKIGTVCMAIARRHYKRPGQDEATSEAQD